MKGLLIKDLKLMTNQKQFFALIAFVGVLNYIAEDQVYFAINYIAVMFAMITVIGMSYDELDNVAPYLFTLPFDRRKYVVEKYLLGMLACLSGWLLSVILAAVTKIIKTQVLGLPVEFDLATVGVVSLAAVTLGIVMIAVSLPIEIKFGVEKRRIAFISILILGLIGFYLITRMVGEFQSGILTETMGKITSLPVVANVGIVVAVWIFMIVVSMLISIRFINRKEY